jgi:hypothetical protein
MNMDRLTVIGLGVVIVSACAVTATLPNGSRTGDISPWFDTSLESLVADSLRRFRGAAELERYRARLQEAAEQRGAWWASSEFPGPRVLTASTEPLTCDPGLEECPVAALEEITVSGSRVSAPSITNNQEAGVDEGDIVKQFGRFLIVLQDGRLFSIDTGDTAGAMVLADRIDVYPSPDRGTWYDELLIMDDGLIVTGYDYTLDVSELALFRIDANGVFTYDATIYLESDDYYSENNYASRVVDGNLILYTPLYLTDSDTDEPLEFPRVRRWTTDGGYSEWQPLFAPTDIYLPIQRTLDPVVHTVSVCSLDSAVFSCRSTGVIGPGSREFYVSPEYAYLWVSSDQERYDWGVADCEPGPARRDFRPVPATLYRVSLADGRATAVFTAGVPKDQFSLEARERQFMALLWWVSGDCIENEDYGLRYARIPTAAFSTSPTPVALERYHPLPRPSGDGIENRFTEDYLVYGGAQGRWAAYYGRGDYVATDLIAVPVDAPQTLTTVSLAHSAERVEVFGGNVIVDGYRGTGGGLNVSTIDLRRHPQVGDTLYLETVLESEGRSHAFNGLADANGSGVFGLPTTFRRSLRAYDDEAGSNIHFFTVEPTLDIRTAGYLAPDPSAVDEDYECEVSCVDWYGNARPIFMNGRVFALSSAELIEASFVNGQMLERQRIAITGIPLHRR